MLLCAACVTQAAPVDWILTQIPQARGLIVLPNETSGDLALKLAEHSGFLVFAQLPELPAVVEARRRADEKGLLERRCLFETGDGTEIKLADHYADLIVLPVITNAALSRVSSKEILRALTPVHGKALVGGGVSEAALKRWAGDVPLITDPDGKVWAVLSKPMPDGTDDWGHWYHAPDNNNVSSDEALRWPFMFQWLGLPYYGAQPRTTVISAGRLFSATGLAGGADPASREYANRSLLTAHNAFNGLLLWQKTLDEDCRVSSSFMIAAPDAFYMINGPDVLALNPSTGEEKKRIVFTDLGEEKGKWIALQAGILYIMAGSADVPSEKTGYILSYKYPEPPVSGTAGRWWGGGNTLAAYDLKTGATLWVHHEPTEIDSRTVGIGEGKLIFAGKGGVCALDLHTGGELWRNQDPAVVAALNEPVATFASVGTLNSLGSTRPGILVTPEIVTIQIYGMKQLVTIATATGKLLWTLDTKNKGGTLQPLWLDGQLYSIAETFDPKTGKSKGRLNVNPSGCGPVNASPYGFYSRHGLSYDRITKKEIDNHAFRSGCWQDALPANGLLINTPYGCTCSYSIKGFVVQTSVGDFKPEPEAREEDRLEFFRHAEGPAATPEDWPTYRGNNERNGSTPIPVAEKPAELWCFSPNVHAMPTAPISANETIFYADDRGMVYCLNGVDGKERWRFPTGGEILAAPTYQNGRVFVGSSDGFCYALNARTGELLWRFRCAPANRRIMIYDHLSSQWPAVSGILANGNTVYIGAGLIDSEGTHLYALNAATGKIVWQNNSSGSIVDAESRKGVSVQGNLMLANGVVWLASGNTVSPVGYRADNGTVVLPSFVSRSAYKPVRRGRDIGLFAGQYILHGGELLYSHADERRKFSKGQEYVFAKLDGSNVRFPELAMTASGSAYPAWDSKGIVVSMNAFNQPEYWDVPGTLVCLKAWQEKADVAFTDKKAQQVESFISASGPQDKDRQNYPMKKWELNNLDLYAIALTENAALFVCGNGDSTQYRPVVSKKWSLKAVSRENGKELWSIELPAEPATGMICIDRNGRIIVPFLDGSLRAYGS